MRFGRDDGDVNHLEEWLRQIRLTQPLTWVDKEPPYPVGGHLFDLPLDLVCGESVVPEPERVETRGPVSHDDLLSRFAARRRPHARVAPLRDK